MSSDGPAIRGATGSGGGGTYENSVREQDRFLPIANISRIMKKALPTNAKIAKDAKETVQECVSEFISFITSEASDKCQREKRKTINGEDLLWALSTLGFEEYVEPLKLFLQKHREFEGEKGSGLGKSAEDGKGNLGGSPSQLLEGQSQDASLEYPLHGGSGLHHSTSPGQGHSSPNLLQ